VAVARYPLAIQTLSVSLLKFEYFYNEKFEFQLGVVSWLFSD